MNVGELIKDLQQLDHNLPVTVLTTVDHEEVG